MSQFCLIYPSPPEHRQKRQIVTECCYNKCSLDYLLENYCGTVDMEALERFKLMDSEPVETTTAISKRSRRNRLRISSEEKELMRSSLRSRRGRRGKRNCTCKKHHRGRKSKKSKQKLQEILSRRKAPLPEAKIGEIEEHQDPFYVIDFSK
ncbi:hypothetical protein JTB14_035624 [Gonioctena quinquepunctata]|nr:hypothetical protein JTB14_035624 [Gonioctena quinquepunctata]